MTSLALVGLLTLSVGYQMNAASADVQPNMQAALGSLETALDSLQRATPDKGGHRVKAISYTKAAIDQVRRGVSFDNNH